MSYDAPSYPPNPDDESAPGPTHTPYGSTPPPPSYGSTPPPPAYGSASQGNPYANDLPEHPQGTTLLVMGILGLVCCSILAPITWFMASSAQNDINSGRYKETSMVKVGKILGMVGTGLMVLSLIFLVLMFAVGMAAPEPTPMGQY